MSFENLSPTWTDQPLTDPALTADVIDLMVSHGDRHRGTLTVLICDPGNHYQAGVAMALPPHCIPLPEQAAHSRPTSRSSPALSPAELCESVMDPVIPAVHTAPGVALVLALGRPGPAYLPDLDNQWAQAATAICRAAGIRLLGFYVATKHGIYHPDLVANAAA
jgi:hypothetical protein